MRLAKTFLSISALFFVTVSSAVEHPLPASVAADAKLEEVYADKGVFFEGPAWDRNGNKLYFTTYRKTNQQILRLDDKGKASVWLDKSQDVTGMRFSKEGRLLGAQCAGHRIMSYAIGEKGPADSKVLYLNEKLFQPNDLWQTSDGSIYFTDPDFKGKKDSSVWKLKPDGTAEKLPIQMTLPNGIAVSMDEKTLYVSDSAEKLWRSFPIKKDGTVGEGKVFFKPETENKGDPDGMTLDVKGNLYASGMGGIWVISPEGKELGFIPVPEFPSNVAFGGNNGNTLYITCGGKVYSIETTTRGVLWRTGKVF